MFVVFKRLGDSIVEKEKERRNLQSKGEAREKSTRKVNFQFALESTSDRE